MTGKKHELGACGFHGQDWPLSPGHRDSLGKGDCFQEIIKLIIISMELLGWSYKSINTEFEEQQEYKESLGSWSLLLWATTRNVTKYFLGKHNYFAIKFLKCCKGKLKVADRDVTTWICILLPASTLFFARHCITS